MAVRFFRPSKRRGTPKEVENVQYKEEYLEKHFDGFEFFDPECRDRRVREVWLRSKRCLEDPGFPEYTMYPNNWMTGAEQRRRENNKLGN